MALDSKRMAGIRIYSILKDYSDREHLLTQKHIAHSLERDYGIELERKAISNYLYDLQTGGFNIEITRKGAYLDERVFDDSQIHMLVDAVLGSKYISKNHSEEIIGKLCGLSNKHFRSSLKNVHTLDTWEKSDNQSLFYNVEMISEALNGEKRIQFLYNKYGMDKKLHPVTEEPYTVRPCQLVLTDGNYYMVGNFEDRAGLFNFRLDRITGLKIIDDRRKKSILNNTDLQIGEYVKTHPYMYSGEPKTVKMLVRSDDISEVIDFFGKDIRILSEENGVATVSMNTSIDGVCKWALQHGDLAEVIEPVDARAKVRSAIYKMNRTYSRTDDDRYYDNIENAKKYGMLWIDNIDLTGREAHKHVENIRSIRLIGNNIENVDFLANYPDLKTLIVRNNNISDFSVVRSLHKLITLDISETGITDISFLKDCKSLKKLVLEEVGAEDFSVLYELCGLRSLTVSSLYAYKIDAEKIKEKNPGVEISVEDGAALARNQKGFLKKSAK